MNPERSHDPGDALDNPFLGFRSRTLIWWMIVVGFALGLVVAVVSSVTSESTRDLLGEVAVHGLVAAWIVWACRAADVDLGRLIGRVPAEYNWLPAVGLLATAITFSIGSWSLTAYGLSHLAPELLESFLTFDEPVDDSMVSYVWLILGGVAVGPVLEEVLFRGIFVNRWGVKWGLRIGIIISSAVFGILHFDLLGATAFGLVTALLYLQFRTLIVPIVFHVANNLVATVAMLIPGSDEPWTLAAELEEIEAMALPGLAMVAVTLPILIWYVRRHWPSPDAEIPYVSASPSKTRGEESNDQDRGR